jgi:hypothetical protein
MDTDPIVFKRRVIRTAPIVMAVAIEMSNFSTKHGLASQPVTVEGRILSQVIFPDLIPTFELFLGFLIQPLIDLGVIFKEILRSPIDSFFVVVSTVKSRLTKIGDSGFEFFSSKRLQPGFDLSFSFSG